MNLLSACNDKFKMKTLTINGYLRVNIKYIHVYKNTGLKYVIKESLVVSFGIFFNSLYVIYSLAMASWKIFTIC